MRKQNKSIKSSENKTKLFLSKPQVDPMDAHKKDLFINATVHESQNPHWKPAIATLKF